MNSIFKVIIFRFVLIVHLILFSAFSRAAGRTSEINIVLIVSDDHGMNDLGCYGNSVIHTPNLDALAAEGIRFNNAYCTSASCTASRSVILTGLYNHANGLYGHNHHFHHFQAFKDIRSLPVFLEELGGYRTARAGKYHVGPEQVFRFNKVIPGHARNPVEMADNSKDFISCESGQPFFLYFCTDDPHRSQPVSEEHLAPDSFGNRPEGYDGVTETVFTPDQVIVPPFLPDTRESRKELAQYYQSVARLDYGLGRLFEHLKNAGVWENSLIIYISDNGMAFEGAKTTHYQPGINLPCIIKLPGSFNKGSVNNAFINWADLTPTLLDFAGILHDAEEKMKMLYESGKHRWDNTLNREFHGRSFKNILISGRDEEWNETYASHTFHEITMYYPMRTVITGRFKLIWNASWQLPYSQAKDLWESSTWQSALLSADGMYGPRKISSYLSRFEFELFDLKEDPLELNNLAMNEKYHSVLNELIEKIKAFQKRTNDPWFVYWERNEALKKMNQARI